MSLFAGIKHALHSARKIEIILLAVLVAAAGLMLTKGNKSYPAEGGLETRLESVLCCIQGAGRVKVALNQDEEGVVIGVVVASEGAGDMRTYLDIQKAVHTFTGADISNIEILVMGDGI